MDGLSELKLKGATAIGRGGGNLLDRTTAMAMRQESRRNFDVLEATETGFRDSVDAGGGHSTGGGQVGDPRTGMY